MERRINLIETSKQFTEMARLLILFAVCLCVLPAIATAIKGDSFLLKGKVYCDTCRVGYETTASKYLAGKFLPFFFNSFFFVFYFVDFVVFLLVGIARSGWYSCFKLCR